MARWFQSRLRVFGGGAAAVVGASLLVIPTWSYAEQTPAPAAAVKPAVAAEDRIATIAGAKGRSAFQFKPASGDRNAPFGFVSTGGALRVEQLGAATHKTVQAKTGAPVRAAQADASAATYKTTLTLATQNWTAWHKTINVWNRATWAYVPITNPENSLSATASLPPGDYYATAMYGIYGVNSYLLTKTFTVTNKTQTVTLDEKSAKEVAIKVDDTTARRDVSAVWMSLPNGDLVGFAGGPHTRSYVTTASVAGTTLRAHELLIKTGSSALKPSPYRYDLVKSWPHPLPASPITSVKTASLAKTVTTIRAQGITTDGAYQTVPMTGEWTGVYLPTALRVPATITEYVSPNVTMSRLVNYGSDQQLSTSDRSLPAGTSPSETVGAGPLVPSRRSYNDDSYRDRNKLYLLENMTLGDAAGNKGSDFANTTSMTLSSGGQVLRTTTGASLAVDVPAIEQAYQLDQTTTRKVGWSLLSEKIRSEWTFSSAGPSYGNLPLMDLALAASGLDQRNRAGSAPVGLAITPSTRVGSPTNTVDKLEWSSDDGTTWNESPLTAAGGVTTASLTVPADAAFVSLRISASNDKGGALRRTVLRAIAGPATPGDETIGATTISNVKINGGKTLVVGPSGSVEFYATFTAADPSGIARGGFYLWHGGYLAPDGLLQTHTECAPVNETTANCTAQVYIWDVRYLLASNALAGTWRAEAWASAKDRTGFADRRSAGTLSIKRATYVTTDATPEPVKKGKTITVTGALTRADWNTGINRPYSSQNVALQWAKAGSWTYNTVKTVKADANGKLKTTMTAKTDGSYRYSFAGDAASQGYTSASDYIDVR